MRIKFKFKNESDKSLILEGLSKGFNIIKIHPVKKSDVYCKMYVDLDYKER